MAKEIEQLANDCRDFYYKQERKKALKTLFKLFILFLAPLLTLAIVFIPIFLLIGCDLRLNTPTFPTEGTPENWSRYYEQENYERLKRMEEIQKRIENNRRFDDLMKSTTPEKSLFERYK